MLPRDFAKNNAHKTGQTEDWAAYKAKRNHVNLEVKRTKNEYSQKTPAAEVDNPVGSKRSNGAKNQTTPRFIKSLTVHKET